jgi:import inner membrane translocase subunit TIM44
LTQLVTAKILDNFDIPVLVLSFNTQEVIVFRDRLTNEIKYGSEDQIDQNTYGCVFTKQEDRIMDPVTNGWKMIGNISNLSLIFFFDYENFLTN